MSFERTGYDGSAPWDFTTRGKSRSRSPSEDDHHYLILLKKIPEQRFKSSQPGASILKQGGHQPKDLRDSLTRARDAMKTRFSISSPNPEVYDQMGTVFGLGSSVHAGTELALKSRKAAIVLTKHMGPEAAIALRSTAGYVGKVATITSRGATVLSGGYSVYEISTNQAKAHTWVNLSVITLTVAAEALIGVTAAPYIIVGGIAYGVFCIAGGNDWLDSINFKRWFN